MQLLRTHKIGLHSSKPSYAYPIILLLREFHGLAGSNVEIYQTVHEGALVFLSKLLNVQGKAQHGLEFEKKRLARRRSGVRIASSSSALFPLGSEN
jgi:hypothetical protein